LKSYWTRFVLISIWMLTNAGMLDVLIALQTTLLKCHCFSSNMILIYPTEHYWEFSNIFNCPVLFGDRQMSFNFMHLSRPCFTTAILLFFTIQMFSRTHILLLYGLLLFQLPISSFWHHAWGFLVY
jgi:hypothetical protein